MSDIKTKKEQQGKFIDKNYSALITVSCFISGCGRRNKDFLKIVCNDFVKTILALFSLSKRYHYEEAKHCLMCGETHDGKCSPDAFADLQCQKCKVIINMPWDAALMGTEGIQCSCAAENSFVIISDFIEEAGEITKKQWDNL